jgi:hypothetical protein
MRICNLCTGCPDNDPTPAGVIRQGVPYADTGKRIPLCPNCGRPHMGYKGGNLTLCRLCAVPDIEIPSARLSRNARIVALAKQDVPDDVIAADVGLSADAVGKLRRRLGVRRRAAPLPVPAGVA